MAAMGGAWFSSDMSFSGDFRMENICHTVCIKKNIRQVKQDTELCFKNEIAKWVSYI